MDLNELFRANYGSYLKFYKARCGSQEDAEDVIQEAFARAIKYWSSYDPNKQKLEGWFLRVMSNAYKDWRTDNRNGGLVRQDLEDASTIPAEEKPLLKENLMSVINNWHDENQKEVLRLHYILGYKPKEVAHITDYSYGHIRNVLSSFMKSLE